MAEEDDDLDRARGGDRAAFGRLVRRHQRRVYAAALHILGNHSDADDVFIAGDGIATGIVCVPLRYMHTAGEIVQLSDADDACRLIEAYARSLTAASSFLR